jgi:hypothetical protein
VVIRNLIQNDATLQQLIERTNLTRTQLDTYIIHKESEGMSLGDQLALRDGSRVSMGSFMRTLQQSRRNIKEAAYTLVVLGYLDLLPEEVIMALIKIGKSIKEKNLREREHVIEALEQLLQRIM